MSLPETLEQQIARLGAVRAQIDRSERETNDLRRELSAAYHRKLILSEVAA